MPYTDKPAPIIPLSPATMKLFEEKLSTAILQTGLDLYDAVEYDIYSPSPGKFGVSENGVFATITYNEVPLGEPVFNDPAILARLFETVVYVFWYVAPSPTGNDLSPKRFEASMNPIKAIAKELRARGSLFGAAMPSLLP